MIKWITSKYACNWKAWSWASCLFQIMINLIIDTQVKENRSSYLWSSLWLEYVWFWNHLFVENYGRKKTIPTAKPFIVYYWVLNTVCCSLCLFDSSVPKESFYFKSFRLSLPQWHQFSSPLILFHSSNFLQSQSLSLCHGWNVSWIIFVILNLFHFVVSLYYINFLFPTSKVNDSILTLLFHTQCQLPLPLG